jgi:branched-chain amino acid aminotransferase
MHYVNGEFVDDDKAFLPAADLGILRGFGVFDYLRTYRKRPFHLEDHLQRLAFSARQLQLPLPLLPEKMTDVVHRLIAESDLSEVGLKIVVTGGVSPDQLMPGDTSSLTILTSQVPSFAPHLYANGMSVITTSLQRSVPAAKTTHYVPAILALREAKQRGAHDALFTSPQGDLWESTTSNFFAFSQGSLVTSDAPEVLHGITREVILRLAAGEFPTVFRSIPGREISLIDEAFICSSAREIMPVVMIDGQVVGSGRVGPKTRRVIDLFTAYTSSEMWPPLGIHRYLNI